MVIFNSFLYVYQRVTPEGIDDLHLKYFQVPNFSIHDLGLLYIANK